MAQEATGATPHEGGPQRAAERGRKMGRWYGCINMRYVYVITYAHTHTYIYITIIVIMIYNLITIMMIMIIE